MRKLVFAVAALSALSSVAAAQQQQPVTTAQTVLQNMIGNMAGQNAQLVERIQQLTSENAELKKELAAKSEGKKK
jgi:hypothetical protein